MVCSAQNFNGDYRSYKTSFQDFSSTKNNFIEETEFRIAVLIQENGKDGRVAIQDPRIPYKLLIYKVTEYIGELENEGIKLFLYKCIPDHLDIPIETILTFNLNTKNELSLMVYDDDSSQYFFNLKINK
jgi:hypothetical protein